MSAINKKIKEKVVVDDFSRLNEFKASLEVNQDLLSPITEKEQRQANHALQAPDELATDELTVLAPVPNDAPKFTLNTPEYFNKKFNSEPSYLYAYHDKEGQLMSYTVRWDNVLESNGTTKKKIIPYAYVEEKKTKRRFWSHKGLPEPRPLYNLPAIITRANDMVLVVEGEKTAEAAKSVFPDWVVTTSAFGANAADKTDWTVLSGKNIIICPDCDESGKSYGGAVCSLGKQAGCASIQLLDLPKLMKEVLNHQVGADSGYDLADAVQDGLTSNHLKALPLEPFLTPWIVLPNNFRLNKQGKIEYKIIPKNNQDGGEEWRFLCAYLVITHQKQSDKGNGWSKVAKAIDASGRRKEIEIPLTLLAGDGTDVKKLLLDQGIKLSLEKGAKEKLLEYINKSSPCKIITYVNKIGWHGNNYILPSKTYGLANNECLHIQGIAAKFIIKGNLEDWHKNVGKYAVGNCNLQIAILIALTAPLLTPLGRENFGIHLLGSSSIGKSTALRVACSIYGSEFRSWRTTDNSAESWGMYSNDNLLALDDMGQASAKAVSEMVYMLGNGQGKGRANRNGEARDVVKFNVCFLSTGEIGVEQKLQESKDKLAYHAGQAIRLLEIPAEKKYGLFDDLNDFNTGAKLSEHLKNACNSYQGILGDAWLNYLINHYQQALESVKEYEQKFMDLTTINDQEEGQISRAKGHFALMAAVGELAINQGILEWDEGSAIFACKEIFNTWLVNRGGTEAHEYIELVKDTTIFLQRETSSRFEIIHKTKNYSSTGDDFYYTNQTTHKRAGFKEIIDNKWIYFVFTDVFQAEVIKNRNKNKALKILVEKGFLEKGNNQFAVLKQLPRLCKKRVYKMQLPVDE